jgi:Domain of unknown function (DUF4124)
LKPFYRHSLNAIVLVVISAGSLASPEQINYYRWLDGSGNPIVSDRPPPAGTDYEVVSTQSTMKRSVEAEEGAVPLAIDPTTGAEITQQESAEAEAQRIKQNAELCEKAKSNLEALSGTATVTIRNDEGEARALTPQEMEIQRTTTTSQIKVYCKE